jgi:hypothetical protein
MIDYTRLDRSLIFYEKFEFKRIEIPFKGGFLWLYERNFLPKGRFMSITPVFDKNSFSMKNELIITDDVSLPSLVNIINICKDFYEKELNTEVKLVKTNDGFYLEVNGIEIGSYGIKKNDHLEWIYAIGCNEPKLSIIKNSL